MTKKHEAGVEADLEKKIAASQASFTKNLQKLTYELQPRVQLDYALEEGKYQARKVSNAALDRIDDAKDGDLEARQQLLKVLGIAVGVVALCVLRRKLIKRRKG